MAVQEFQWFRSLATLLLKLVPANLSRLRWTLRLRFAYALSYYFLLVATTLAGLVLAPVAAVTGQQWIKVNYLAFLGYWWAISAFLIAIVLLLLRRRGLLRPRRAPVVSWESWLYSLARWPFVALGIGAALIGLIRPRPVSFKVTPKGSGGLEKLPARLTLPFAAISLAAAGAALAGERLGGPAGYVLLSALTALTYAVVALAIPVRHALEARGVVADPSRADKRWGWRTSRDVTSLLRDAWRFEQLNPYGYQEVGK